MSLPEAGQATERDEHGMDGNEQQKGRRMIMAMVKSLCAVRYRKADDTPCPIEQRAKSPEMQNQKGKHIPLHREPGNGSDLPDPPRLLASLASVRSAAIIGATRRGKEIIDLQSPLPSKRAERRTKAMSLPDAGQAAERDEHGRDDYEQKQARVLMALMQGIWAARYRKADNTPCPIEQGLYLGSVGAALNKEALKSLNISHILIVARSLNPAYPAEFNYKKIEGILIHQTITLTETDKQKPELADAALKRP
nr:unnamed protein product [Digitaria exilis]